MASGYIHITRKDLIFDEENGVVYWKNGARFLGEIAKAVLNEGEENETVKYYLKSAVTKKAILIDAGVIVGGGLYYFVTDDANFINVRIETADFSSDGGGDGVTVTFLLPESKYYTVRYVEENGDIKLFDVDGDAGTLVPDALPDTTDASAGDALVLDSDKKPVWGAVSSGITKYLHICNFGKTIDSAVAMGMIIYIDETETPNVTNFLINNNHRGTTNPYYGIYGYHNTAELFSVYYSSNKINFQKRTTSGTISFTGDTEVNLDFNYVTYKIKGE